MQLTSCLLDGVELLDYLRKETASYTKESGDRVATASLEFIGVASTLGPLVSSGMSVEIMSDLGTEFIGRVSRVEPVAQTLAPEGAGVTIFKVQCQDLMSVLNETIIETEYNYTSGSPTADADAIQEVFGDLTADIDVSSVASVASALELRAPIGWTLKQFMTEVAGRTGAVFYLDGDVLKYHAPTALTAPFGIRDFTGSDATGTTGTGLVGEILTGEFLPGGGDPIPVNCGLYEGFQYTEEWSAPANRIIVKGKAGTLGVRVTSGVVSDAASIAAHGTKSIVITDDNIQTETEAGARALVELAQRKEPQKSCSFKIRVDGLAVGQTLSMIVPALKLSATFFINRITTAWPSGILTYTVECGYYRPNNIYNQYKTAQAAQNKPYVNYALPAPGTVSSSSFASSIQPIVIVNVLPTLPDASYPDDSVVILTTDHKLYRNAAGSWTAEVPTTDLAGTITTTQIADDSISTPKLKANSVTATNIAAGSITSGKIATGAVIAGTIAAGAIRASDAAFAAAAIQTADIADLAVTNAKINSLSASKLTAGTIDAATITVTNLSATNITSGTLDVARISAGSITGTKLADGTISDVKIASGLSASKITTGTLDASSVSVTNLNASNITTGTLNASVVSVTNINASNITTGTLSASRIGAGTISASISLTGATLSVANSATFSSGITISSGNLFVNNQITANTSFAIGATTVIDSSAAFVGAGVACPSNGIGGSGFNVYQAGWYFGITGPSTFTTADGKTVTVRGGIITSIV